MGEFEIGEAVVARACCCLLAAYFISAMISLKGLIDILVDMDYFK